MAIETLKIKDANGVDREVYADAIDDGFSQVVKLAFGEDGALTLVGATAPLPVENAGLLERLPAALVLGALPTTDGGTYGYAAGVVAGTVDVPAAARLKRVTVVANAASATTVMIGGGALITIPPGAAFDEQIPGAAIGADVIIGGGTPQSYYVSWVV